jgi:antitoxin VapB
MWTMTINITNKEADRLTRKLAKMEGVGVTEAVVIAMKEALAKRNKAETPMEVADRLRAEFGVVLTDEMRKPLPQSAWDEISGEQPGWREDA